MYRVLAVGCVTFLNSMVFIGKNLLEDIVPKY